MGRDSLMMERIMRMVEVNAGEISLKNSVGLLVKIAVRVIALEYNIGDFDD